MLAIESLRVAFDTDDGIVTAVDDVSVSVERGECLGVVGESGSGKTQTFMALLGLLPKNARVQGSIRFDGRQIAGLEAAELKRLRGAKVTMIFQDSLSALTPHIPIGEQIAAPLRLHLALSHRAAKQRALSWLERVRIDDASRRFEQYPHELSGGMRQRVMIACAMACEPALVIADEPTTALDVTVQAQILDLMLELKRETGTGFVLITHDMGVVARMADRVCVMHHGCVVEAGDVEQVFSRPAAEYTRTLLAAVPGWEDTGRGSSLPKVAAGAATVIECQDMRVSFQVRGGLFERRRVLRAVDGVSFRIREGETLGVVGESGSGKSTLARAVLKLLPDAATAASGTVTLLGRELQAVERRSLRRARKDLQIVFQDPFSSLDPRMTVGDSIAEPLLVHAPQLSRGQREHKVAAMMDRVRLSPDLRNRYPHELSGGQNQRVGIARAMILEPRLVICDEAVSAVDASVRDQLLALLIELQRSSGLALMFISHDLSAVYRVSHEVMVLYLGRVVELGPRDEVYARAAHPYTRILLESSLVPDPARARLRKPLDPAALRLVPERTTVASTEPSVVPRLLEVSPGHFVAGHSGP